MAKEKEPVKFLYDALTDEEIDNRLCKCIDEAKNGKCNYNYRWKDEDLALRNYAIWKLLYKEGRSRADSVRNIKQRWNISQKTAYEYIKVAENEVNETYDETIEQYRSKSMEKAQKLYKMAIDNNQPKVALQALDMINKLQGMYTENVNKTVTVNEIKFDFD